ncbi:putative hydrolase or acyltransferase of alpha/beta superfamily [Caulobacter sp. AP07]|uniref:alpha/beta fold hydrolase n=1 Tax=Caulobacter sp. AP07 TaxID=1144304 RepID=UPI0002720C52|nr:alpha/beta hydrolase [Caulobacter sp. AP07]EJL27327.1 putative hydrolase or acyltransferase of alpha/beta superfamily [Caulobacter sp. AP07]
MSKPTFARTVLGAGPGVALAHGMGGSIAAHYGPVLAGLSSGRTVVGVDYPGSGDTPRSSTPLSLDQLADEIVAAAVDEGLETFALIGFSMGGPVAIRAAARHPDRISALVLNAAYPCLDNYMTLATEASGELLASNPMLFGKIAALLSLSPAAVAAMPMDMVRAIASGAAAGLSPGAPEQAELFGRIDVRGDLGKIKAPTLVVGTAEDRLTPIGLQRGMAAQIPGARMVDFPTGHLLFLESPEEWLKLATAFLDEVGA